MPTNEFGQPIGPPLGDWRPPPVPPAEELTGRTVVLQPLESRRHAKPLFEAYRDAADSLWTYLAFGPCADPAELGAAITALADSPARQAFAVVVEGRPVGLLAYIRIAAAHGVLEIGSLAFSPALQRTTAATETVSLLIGHAFRLGYRRVEWKCDDLNAPSRAAALRYGFRYEGTFRNAITYKGRSRDTAWYSIIDDEWPAIRAAHRAWLAPDNFDEEGRQRQPLALGDRSRRSTRSV
ncbi:MAG: GNAT family protein [Microthrixaceae bacterium]